MTAASGRILCNVKYSPLVEEAPLRAWFTPWGWTYRPVSVAGFVLVALAAIFCVQVFVAIDRHSHSVSDTLYGIYPFVVPTLIVLHWIASKTAGLRS